VGGLVCLYLEPVLDLMLCVPTGRRAQHNFDAADGDSGRKWAPQTCCGQRQTSTGTALPVLPLGGALMGPASTEADCPWGWLWDWGIVVKPCPACFPQESGLLCSTCCALLSCCPNGHLEKSTSLEVRGESCPRCGNQWDSEPQLLLLKQTQELD
jgi:hypothetical protein